MNRLFNILFSAKLNSQLYNLPELGKYKLHLTEITIHLVFQL